MELKEYGTTGVSGKRVYIVLVVECSQWASDLWLPLTKRLGLGDTAAVSVIIAIISCLCVGVVLFSIFCTYTACHSPSCLCACSFHPLFQFHHRYSIDKRIQSEKIRNMELVQQQRQRKKTSLAIPWGLSPTSKSLNAGGRPAGHCPAPNTLHTYGPRLTGWPAGRTLPTPWFNEYNYYVYGLIQAHFMILFEFYSLSYGFYLYNDILIQVFDL